MSVSFINSCSGTTSCASVPAHKPGDLFLVYAGRDATTTAPTNPAGWTSVNTSSINGTSTADSVVRLSCKVATSSSETITGFTNAGGIVAVIYRGTDISGSGTCGALGTPSFFDSTVNTTTTTETFNSLTAASDSFVAGFGYAPAATAGMGTAPSTMTNRQVQGTILGAHDNGPNGGGSFTTANVTITTASRIITAVVEIKNEQTLTACSGTCAQMVQYRDWGSNTGGATGSTFTYHLPHPTSSGNLLACGVSWDGGNTITATITDNQGNTWSHGPSATSSSTRNIKIDYVLPAIAGTQDLTLTLSTAEFNVHMMCAEFANVSATDVAGTAATAIGGATHFTTNKPGSFTTTQVNDLIFMYGVDDTSLNNGTAQAVTNLTIAGTNYSLGSVDTWSPRFGAWINWGGSGAINPAANVYQSLNGTTRDAWNMAAMSFKTSATGTIPTGMRINRAFVTTPPNAGTGATVQVPCSGNLMVATGSTQKAQFDLYSGHTDGTTAWTDTDSNTYTAVVVTGGPQIIYAKNAICTNVNQRTISLGWTNGGSPDPIMFYDIAGADPNPLDTGVTTSTSGASASSGVIQSGGQNQGETTGGGTGHYSKSSVSCNAADSNSVMNFTPSAANGIAIVVENNGEGPECAASSTNNVFDATWFGGENDACCGSLNSSSGYGHIAYSSAATQTYTFNWANCLADPGGTTGCATSTGLGSSPGSSYFMLIVPFKAAATTNLIIAKDVIVTQAIKRASFY